MSDKVTVTLERHEIEHLISYHQESEYEAARRQQYGDAAYHKLRGKELRGMANRDKQS